MIGSDRALMRASWYPSAPATGVLSFGQFTYLPVSASNHPEVRIVLT